MAVTAGVTVVSGVALTVAAAAVAGAAGVTAVSVGALAAAVGATAVSGVVLTVAAGADGVTGASVVVLTVAAGASGFLAVSAGVLILATGAAAAAAGVLAVSEGVLAVAVDAAAAAQCSDIMLRSVTTKPLSVAAELAPLALCPMRVTSWPRCGLRSTLLVAILKVKPVLFSTSVKLGSEPPKQPLMLDFSVLVLGAEVWANPSAINRAGTTIHRNALFMRILRKILALRRSEISLGI